MSNKPMISVSHGFQYSINIQYDVDNANKIASYIPTDRSISLLEQLLDSLNDKSTDRARIIVGAYGTGKSHLMAVFSALLRNRLPLATYKPVVDKVYGSAKEEIAHKLEHTASEKHPYLMVFINGNDKNIYQSFSQGLEVAIKDSNLNIRPKTAHLEIEKIISSWENDYPSTLKNFSYYLRDRFNNTLEEFASLNSNYDSKAYSIFTELYPLLTSGARFNPYHIDNIADLYEDVSKRIKSFGYKGIYVIFDEFNKHLEAATKNEEFVDLKPLQDFAEMCNRSEENQVHLSLISHQHISQYASKLPNDLMNEWRKIEGRFSTFELHHHSSTIYSLISAVIIKQSDLWQNFIEKMKNNQPFFNRLKEKSTLYGLFKELTEEELDKWVVKGCYPLHPCTTFCLPRLSNKVAQNERSIFTFLATNNFHTLGSFLENINHEEFKLLTLDYLFDYFSSTIRKQHKDDHIYRAWIQANEAINKLTTTDSVAEKVIKAISIVLGLREEQTLPPTKQIIKFALAHSDEEEQVIEEAINNLAKEKIIYVRKSDGKIQFFSGSDEDFGAEISNIKNNHKYQAHFHLSAILNEYFTPYPVIANRYNDKFEMTRYFLPVFFTKDELLKGIDWEQELQTRGYLDGILALVITENKEEYNEILSSLDRLKHPQVLFALTRKQLKIREEAFDYKALQILYGDQQFLSKSPLIEVELKAYLDDFYDSIEEELSSLIAPQLNETTYYYMKEEIAINSAAKLSQHVSKICETVFGKTPKINNEMINKTNISTNIAKAREKINDKIIHENVEGNIGLTGYGPDISIFRSLLKRTGLYHYNEEKQEALIVKTSKDQNLQAVLKEIDIWVNEATEKSSSFSDIYHILRKPPYGIRPGIIPILLALSIKDYKETLLIKDKDGMEQPLTAKLIETIDKYPHHYSIQLEAWEKIKEIYIQILSEMFCFDATQNIPTSTNKIYPVATAIKSWFVNLPKYTRESKHVCKEALSLQKALKNPLQDSRQLIFEQLPYHFKANMQDLTTEAKLNELIGKIDLGKTELDNFKNKAIHKLNSELITIFNNIPTNDSYTAIMNWYKKLEENTKNHLFDHTIERFFTLINSSYSDEATFIEDIAWLVTGLHINDWNDSTFESFIEYIREIKGKIDSFDCNAAESNNLIEVRLFDPNNGLQNITFEKTETSQLGQTLHNTLEAQIEAYAESISINEKRKVLLELLLNIS